MKKVLSLLLVLTLGLNFAPDTTVKASEDTNVVKQEEEATDITETDSDAVLCSVISSPGDLQNLIDTDLNYSSQDTITTSWSGTSDSHKIVVKEEGWIFISIFEEDKYTECNLYSNSSLTSKIANVHPFSDKTNMLACYVQPGNYYYQISRWTGYEPSITTSYVGFMPATERIAVDKITYSKDKSLAAVTFDYDEDYFESFSMGTIRVVKDTVSYKDITNNDVWKTQDTKNVLKKNLFYATSNGTYTARIAFDEKDTFFCTVTFEITDLSSKAPKTPKVSSYKRGTKTLTGTGVAGMKVYAKVNGVSYAATVGANNTWKITCKSTLKLGTKIKAYEKSAAGVKSKTTTVIVK